MKRHEVNVMHRLARSFRSILFLAAGAVVLPAAPAAVLPPSDPAATPTGSELIVMQRQALLLERPAAGSRVLAKLESGTRLRLLKAGEKFFRVDVASASGVSPSAAPSRKANAGVATGFLAVDAATVFPPGQDGTAAMVSLGAALSQVSAYRTVAAAVLLRASERLREERAPDAGVELLLGETAEALARERARFPAGLSWTSRPCASGGTCVAYSGDAFQRAVELSAHPDSEALERVRDRALAGLLRARFPETSETLMLLWQETAAWLELTESARDAVAVRGSCERLGRSSLSLGRYLLATGKLEELKRVEDRLRLAGVRVASLLHEPREAGRLLSRADLLRAMRGDGSGAFPQEASVRLGDGSVVVRIEGGLGALTLTRRAGSPRSDFPPRTMAAVPVLPVPGSLRLSPDGRTAAWIEVAGPSRLVPVLACLESNGPAREIGFLSAGRPLRDRRLEHVLTTLQQFSGDGERLGFTLLAWSDLPGPRPRLLVVSSKTGQIVFETSNRKKAFRKRTR
jgi:hypothetical protein